MAQFLSCWRTIAQARCLVDGFHLIILGVVVAILVILTIFAGS
jgi:hypothetical protein